MMGPTHALGGAAALATAAVVAGGPEHMPLWAFVLAAASALIPDADNHGGSLLSRPYLSPLKLMTMPLWMGAPHRGRTHSLFGLGAYGLIVLGWGLLFNLGLASLGTGAPQINLAIWVSAAAIGYASHLFLDLFNIPGMLLLWPLPMRIFFPSWRAHKFFPGRFEPGTHWEHFAVELPLTIFVGWFTVANGVAVWRATLVDGSLFAIPNILWRALLLFLHGSLG
jgi:membrane-bound metal-dependent hydrolase YbcI (DUF457 family)